MTKSTLIAITLTLVVTTSAMGQAPPPLPTNLTFRPSTFARPSRAAANFYGRGYRSDYSYGRSYSYSASSNPYYDSVTRNLGSTTFSGLNASRRLYNYPSRLPSSGYGYTNRSFYDSTYQPGSLSSRRYGYSN